MVAQFSARSDAMGASADGYTNSGRRGEELIAAGRRATAELNDYLHEPIPLPANRAPAEIWAPARKGTSLSLTLSRNDPGYGLDAKVRRMPASISACAATACRIVVAASGRGASIRNLSVIRVPPSTSSNETTPSRRTPGN